MIRTVVTGVVQFIVAQLLLVERDLKRQIAKTVAGIAFLLAGALLLLLVVGFGLMGLFFQLADLSSLVRPAFLTSAIGLLVAVVLMLEGWQLLRKRSK